MRWLQGSVEKTSYGQMRNILLYGRYQIGTVSSTKPAHSVHELLLLKLESASQKIEKTTYNLEELRDLESRLVLITGSKAENRIAVDHYLDVSLWYYQE